MSTEPASRAQQVLGRAGLSAWFIQHPVATTLLTLGIVLLGVLAYPRLAVSPLPEVDLPTITIRAALPGASAETMASSVATPLEVQLSAIPGVTEMTSTSALGTVTITLQFTLAKDIDEAAQEVQAAINAAAGRLPADLPNLPTWRKDNPNDSPILVLSARSALMPVTEVSDLVETLLVRQMSQVEGVGDIMVAGQQRLALRIQASPEKLAALGLTLADIRRVVQAATVNQPTGALFGDNRVSTLEANSQIFQPEDYDRLIVAYRDGLPVFLRDVARVGFGPEDAYVQAWPHGEPGVNIVIRRQPGANIVATADRIRDALPQLRELLPASVEVEVINDRTRTIRASLHEVELTLGIAIGLVVLVMGFFLRQVSATAIVAAVLGVSLIVSVAAIYALGFSLNNLTLTALVVAVGFVVDDAIVVVENIHRHLEQGQSRLQAALTGAAEIGFTVVSISFSLIAAFIPLLFMGGLVGRIFAEFALTVTASILVSVVVSLTLAPMLASRFMRAPSHQAPRRSLAGGLLAAYGRALDWSLRHPRIMLALFALAVTGAAASYVAVPKGFFPLQDTGFVIGVSRAAEDISFDAMAEKHHALAEIIGEDPAVAAFTHAIGPTGGSQVLASGRVWIVLKDQGDRDVSAEQFIDRIRPKLAGIPGIQLFLRSAQDINLGAGGAALGQYRYTLKSSDSALLAQWAERLAMELRRTPGLQDVTTDQQLGASRTRLAIDRVAAARFGLSADDISQALYDAFGQRQIAEYQTEVNQYQVILEIAEAQRGDPASLQYFHLRSPLTGRMVPLSAVATLKPAAGGPLSITHDGMFPSVNLSFNLSEGLALGDAVALLREAEATIGMPDSIAGTFRGNAQAFEEALASQPFLILAALLAVYIILGVLYESFVHPLTILSTLPSAGIGAILLLWALGWDFSIMAMIGVVLLIGIVKKNGILLVDFALEAQRERGLPPFDAIREACLVRFRPIMMTTLAALLGAVPLTLGFGEGAELRQPLGIAVVGGLLVSQVLTLFTTPILYLQLDRLFHGRGGGAVAPTPAPRPAE